MKSPAAIHDNWKSLGPVGIKNDAWGREWYYTTARHLSTWTVYP
ncbi:MAG: hypothetical protein ABJA70_10030 [Chryseolinea sp.]